MFESSIECARCGNCCPKNCPAYKIVAGKPTCVENTQISHQPRNRFGCDLTPGQLYDFGYACKAVLEQKRKEGQPDHRRILETKDGLKILEGSRAHKAFKGFLK